MNSYSIDKSIFMLFQINDSLFPIGAYSHSYGLETYIQKKIVKDVIGAYEYICSNLKTNFLYTELLAIDLAYDYAKNVDINKLIELDKKINMSKNPKEIRLAGQKLGSRFIKNLENIKIEYVSDSFKNYIVKSKGKLPTHTIAYGVFCQSVGISKDKAIEGFLYSYTSATVTNCVKSVPLSQTEGQKLLYSTYEVFEEVISKLQDLSEEDLCLSTPGFDIRSMQHETLYSRLYMS